MNVQGHAVTVPEMPAKNVVARQRARLRHQIPMEAHLMFVAMCAPYVVGTNVMKKVTAAGGAQINALHVNAIT